MSLWRRNLHGAWVPLVWKGALETWEGGGTSEHREGKGLPIFLSKLCLLLPQVVRTNPPCQPGQTLWFLKDSM